MAVILLLCSKRRMVLSLFFLQNHTKRKFFAVESKKSLFTFQTFFN